jgi:hypothetical protein
MTDVRLERYAEAYLNMARVAKYRPQAPGDGCGAVSLTCDEAADPERLWAEAVAYAKRFNDEENDRAFNIGCTNFSTNRACIYTIEAARCLCGGADEVAAILLKMALEELRGAERRAA